jgi:hypothetical protein
MGSLACVGNDAARAVEGQAGVNLGYDLLRREIVGVIELGLDRNARAHASEQ